MEIIDKFEQLLESVTKRLKNQSKSFILMCLFKIYFLTSYWIPQANKKLKKNTRNLIRIFILFFTITIAFLSIVSVNVLEIDRSILSNWFLAIGAMIGGIFAIVFTLLEYEQSNSTYIQSSPIHSEYIHDRGQKLSYLFFVLTIIYFFVFSFAFIASKSLSENLVQISITLGIFLIGVVLITIDFLHEQSFIKSMPTNQIKFVEEKGNVFFRNIEKDIKRLAFIIKFQQNINAPNAENVAFLMKKNGLKTYASYVEYIAVIAALLSEQKRINEVKVSIFAINNLVIKYLVFRKSNSSVHLSDSVLLSFDSDSDEMLGVILESINRFGRYLLIEDFEVNAIDLVHLYQSICLNSIHINYINSTPIRENPINTKVTYYFKDYIDEAIRNNRLEVVFQSLYSFEKIGRSVIEKGIDTSEQFIIDQLETIHNWGITNNHIIVVDKCREVWLRFLVVAITKDNEMVIRDVLKKIFNSLIFSQQLPINRLYRSSNIRFLVATLSIELAPVLNMYLSKEIPADGVYTFIDELREVLADYARESNEINLSTLKNIGRFYSFIEDFIIKSIRAEEDVSIKELWNNLLKDYISSSTLFAMNITKFESWTFKELMDSNVIVGITSMIELEDDQLALKTSSALKSILNHFISDTNKTIGYEEPRAALNLVFLGMIALKRGYSKVFTDIKDYLLKYDERYNIKYKEAIEADAGLSENQLLMELLQWRDKFVQDKYSKSFKFDEIDILLDNNIEAVDVDKFIFEVWNACDDRCSLKKEHEAKMHPKK